MKGKYFLDTNVFAYSFDQSDTEKKDTAIRLIRRSLDTGQGIISLQVVQEFLNVATRKFRTPLTIPDAREYVTSFMEPLCDVYASMELIRGGLDIMERWQYSFYDSLIISAAIESQCETLYSEDLQHDQLIFSTRIINPFLD